MFNQINHLIQHQENGCLPDNFCNHHILDENQTDQLHHKNLQED